MPAPSVTNETWDEFWSLTMRADRKRITDNIFQEYPGLAWFQSNAMEKESGGKEIQERVEYAMQDAQWWGDRERLSSATRDTLTSVFYRWRYMAVPIEIAFQEEHENMKGEDIKSLLAYRTGNAMRSMRDAVSATLWSAQTGKTMLGVQDIVADDPTTGTLAGLDRATTPFWRNKYYQTALTLNSTAALDKIAEIFHSASSGNNVPKQIFTTETLFNAYEAILRSTGYARTTLEDPGGVGPAPGNRAPTFLKTPFVFDRDVAAGHLYGFNPMYLKMKVHRRVNFTKTPFRSPYDQMVKVAFILLAVQLCGTNPRRQFVLSNVSAS